MPKSYFEDYDARMVFKDNLQRIMKERGLDQSTVAEKIGRAKSIVSDWYNGKKYPRIDAMQDLAAVCNVTVEELISRQEDIWHSKLAHAYERATISQRQAASNALGMHYIRVCDDRELVFNTKYYLSQAINGIISLSDVANIIKEDYLKSQNSRWKSCTIETYNACMHAIVSGDPSHLDGIQFDDVLEDYESFDSLHSANDFAMSTIAQITGQRVVPVINRNTIEDRVFHSATNPAAAE